MFLGARDNLKVILWGCVVVVCLVALASRASRFPDSPVIHAEELGQSTMELTADFAACSAANRDALTGERFVAAASQELPGLVQQCSDVVLPDPTTQPELTQPATCIESDAAAIGAAVGCSSGDFVALVQPSGKPVPSVEETKVSPAVYAPLPREADSSTVLVIPCIANSCSDSVATMETSPKVAISSETFGIAESAARSDDLQPRSATMPQADDGDFLPSVNEDVSTNHADDLHEPAASTCPIPSQETSIPPMERPRTVTLTDAASNRTMATLKITTGVNCEYMSSDELQELQRTGTNAHAARNWHTADRPEFARGPVLAAYWDENGLFTIDAQAVELRQLAAEITRRFDHPIECHEASVGCVSAKVSAATLTSALQRLVEPFGYVVVSLEGRDIIGPPEVVEYEFQRLAEAGRQAKEILTESPDGDLASSATQPEIQTAEDTAAAEVAFETIVANETSYRRVTDHQQPIDVGMLSRLEPYEVEFGNLAKELIDRGDLTATEGLLRQAVDDFPNSAVLCRMLAEVYLHQGNLKLAKQFAERSLQRSRQNPIANQIYGEILAREGNKSRAEHYLQQARHLRSRLAAD